VTLTVVHVLVGALTLATSWMLTLSCFRLIRAPGATATSAVNSPAATTESSRA
jgi:hypothetical protein